MQQRMRNTKYKFYIICVEDNLFTTLVKNSLVLYVEGYSRESWVDFCCASCEIGTSWGEKHGGEWRWSI